MIDYTPRNIGISKLLKKLDKMSYQCTRTEKEGDAVLINEGREGTGKTMASVWEAGYVRYLTKREIYLYFSLDSLIKKAQSTTGKIFIWDEPAIHALGTDSLNKLNRNLIRLLMTCRINRHFFIINLVDFTKFNQYITVERPLGFIHLFKGRVGHACYIRYKRLESLRRAWDDHHKRLYKKHKNFYIDFPTPEDGGVNEENFNQLDITINDIPHGTLELYEKQKKLAISQIGEENDTKSEKKKLKQEIRRLKKLIGTEPRGLTSNEARALHYKVAEPQIRRWAKIDLSVDNDENDLNTPDGMVLEASDDANMVKTREDGKKIKAQPPNLLRNKQILLDDLDDDGL